MIQRCVDKVRRLRNIAACSMLLVFLFLSGCGKNDLCVGDEVSRVSSPDNRVDAVLTRGNCGATTSYSYRVYLVNVGKTPNENDMVFLSDNAESISVTWQTSKKLLIYYGEARIFKFRNFWSSTEIENSKYVVSIDLMRRN